MASSTGITSEQGTLLVGAGNPLLDISAEVPAAIFEKYGLAYGNAILAEDKHQPIYAELVKDFDCDFIAGGATQNSIRACQWMLGGAAGPRCTAYIGGVGQDDYADRLKAAAESAGVKVLYHVDKAGGAPTGRCAVCVHEKERSLVADVAAANNYSRAEHFESAEVQEVVQQAKFFYCSGFFVSASAETVHAIGAHAAEHDDKKFMLNLAAPFLMQVPPLWEGMKTAIAYADVVFCNEDEAAVLGQVTGWGDGGKDLMAVARELQKSEKKGSGSRMVIFTQGKDPTIVCQGQGPDDTKEHAVPPVAAEAIVDTNGAGDSFVGGFLSRFIAGKSVDAAVQAGHYCASECIQRSGCTYPEKVSYTGE